MILKREVLPPRERPSIAEIELVEVNRRRRERDARMFRVVFFSAILFAVCQTILRWFEM